MAQDGVDGHLTDPFCAELKTTLVDSVRADAELGGESVRGPINRETSPRAEPEATVREVRETLFPDGGFRFEEETVKNNLKHILTLLIVLRDENTHGKQLMKDLGWLFDAQLSPGTVYPELHHLDDVGTLDVNEKVHTKEYEIADSEDARQRLERAVRQHLALAVVFSSAADDIEG